MIVSVAVGWGAAKANTKGHAGQLKSLWEWKEAHERDSNTIRSNLSQQLSDLRVKFEEEMGRLRERVAKKETQNEEVLRRLDNIDESIKTLSDRRHKP